MPPPLPDQPDSLTQLPLASRLSVVPPTATMLGEVEGNPPGDPESPVEARNVTPPCPTGVMKVEFSDVSTDCSERPKLIDTATTPGAVRAQPTAWVIRSLSVGDVASTRRMFAPGAIAWAHSI